MGAHLMPSGEVAPISTSRGAGLGGTPHLFAYPNKDSEAEVIQFGSADTGAQGLCAHVAELADKAIKEKGSFTLVLSGGSLFKALTPLVGQQGVDFSKWHVLFVDERNVPHSSADSNYKGAYDTFLGKVPIPKEQIYAIAEGLPVEAAATEYAGQMLRMDPIVLPRNASGLPVLDLILLGIGPDGHVASLFPNHKELAVKDSWVLSVNNSPKPPPERITMSLPVINAAKAIDVVAFGAGKAEVVQRILEVQSLPGALPAQLVRPEEGKLRWLLDAESSSRLSIMQWQDSKAFPRSS
ncbi:hypothetical protein WJX72_006525 [[Myrmecia] bisecta]|uniref:Probable 6-phosphogluconolactonase n=1 Tax=[Myrmecia] bisecta TaxID=41462 RepID=A0AAW1PQ06_9CHLO